MIDSTFWELIRKWPTVSLALLFQKLKGELIRRADERAKEFQIQDQK